MSGPHGASGLVLHRVGPESAPTVTAIVHAAFADRPALDPPADALAESEESIAELLRPAGGVVAQIDGHAVGVVVLDPDPDRGAVYLRRFGVLSAARGRGVARELARAALHAAADVDGADRALVLARQELPAPLRFWQQQGFAETGRHAPYIELARALPAVATIPTADDMRDLATRIAGVVRAGDVLVLSGDLGAGKTTFTQGLGAALGVRGDITSPTFVIARVHPSRNDGPALVHVDAYRLDGSAELDDLDLDTSLDEAVTVVEWGAGLAETLSESPLEIRITRTTGAAADAADPDALDPRTVEIEPFGPRWLGVEIVPPSHFEALAEGMS